MRAQPTRGGLRNQSDTSNPMSLVWLLNLTFLYEIAAIAGGIQIRHTRRSVPWGSSMSPLDSRPRLFDTEQALRAEANAIHPDKPPVGDEVAGAALYTALHGRGSTALCLSGGGIRSASFALGVIEALAVHPRPAPDEQAPTEDRSLLSQFDYLSTVSGGGYIGSWLSACLARARFPEVWKTLVGTRPSPHQAA